MNNLKKIAGYCWMIMVPFLLAFMIWQAIEKTTSIDDEVQRLNTLLQWGIILVVFIPVCIGFFIFGKYAAAGEYDHLPENSDEI